MAGDDLDRGSFRVGDHFHRAQEGGGTWLGPGRSGWRLRQADSSTQQTRQQRKPKSLAADARQRLHLSGKGLVDRTIPPRLGCGEVTEGGPRTSGVGPRTSTLIRRTDRTCWKKAAVLCWLGGWDIRPYRSGADTCGELGLRKPRSERRRLRADVCPLLRFGQEFVFIDDRGHGYLAIAIIDSYDLAFAAYANTFGERNFRREG